MTILEYDQRIDDLEKQLVHTNADAQNALAGVQIIRLLLKNLAAAVLRNDRSSIQSISDIMVRCLRKIPHLPAKAARDRWRGKFWLRWSEAVAEAGFAPNVLTPSFSKDHLLARLAELARVKGRMPTDAEMRLARTKDNSFPGPEAFYRLGSKADRTLLLRQFAGENPRFSDVAALLPYNSEPLAQASDSDTDVGGFVYMLRLGKHFKVGHTTAVPQRHRQIALELPEAPTVVHYIRTDDPEGIERYWHNRFAAFRANGEWVALTPREVRVFKRRKTM